MADWETVFKDVVDGRPVEGLVYFEGDVQVKTVMKTEYEGDVIDGVFHSPRAAGSPIDIHAPTKQELRNELVTDGEFSAEDADAIVSAFGKRGA